MPPGAAHHTGQSQGSTSNSTRCLCAGMPAPALPSVNVQKRHLLSRNPAQCTLGGGPAPGPSRASPGAKPDASSLDPEESGSQHLFAAATHAWNSSAGGHPGRDNTTTEQLRKHLIRPVPVHINIAITMPAPYQLRRVLNLAPFNRNETHTDNLPQLLAVWGRTCNPRGRDLPASLPPPSAYA